MAFTKKNEEAVSPVIGVILMVAITVILAAVIAAFVFGMAGNIQSSKTVAVTMVRTGANTVGVTFAGGQDAASVTSITSAVGNDAPTTAWSAQPTVGSTRNVNVGGANKRVIITGTFTDGTQQILLDKTL